MKKLLGLSIFIISNLANANEDVSCLSKYKDSLAKKEARYQKAYKKYKNTTNAATSAIISDSYSGAISSGGLLGTIYLQKTSAPKRSDYDMFEKDIIKAAEADLSKYVSLKPTVLEGIYNAAYERYSDVTYEQIQNLINKGFEQGKFCGLLGKKRAPGIKRWVLREIKSESKNSAVVRSPAVINFKEDSKNYPDIDDELNKPLENKIKPE